MESNVISRSSLGDEALERMDAEFVLSSSMLDESTVRAFGGSPLSALGEINPGPKCTADMLDEDSEFEYVDIDSVQPRDGLILSDQLVFSERPSRAQHILNAGDILISNVRPARGAITQVTTRTAGAIASSGFSLFRPNDPGDSDFIFLFLRSSWGKSQLIRRSRGSMYPAVLPRDVQEIFIPAPNREVSAEAVRVMNECRRGWRDFFELTQKSQDMIAELFDPIGYPPGLQESNKDGTDASRVRFSECFGAAGAQRIDAEYFRSEYADFSAKARQQGARPLGELCNPVQGRVKPGADLIPTFRQGVLSNYGVNWSAVGLELGTATTAAVREGDVLLAAMAHEAVYLGKKADYVRNLPAEMTNVNQAVHHLMVLRLKEEAIGTVSGSYIAAVLRSPFGMHQVQRCNRGVRGDHVKASDLAENVLIPIPPAGWLDTFDDVVARAEGARNQALTALQGGLDTIHAWVKGAA